MVNLRRYGVALFQSTLALGFLMLAPITADAQTAQTWYPAQNPGLMVANAWYDTRQDWASDGRIGIQFTSGMTAYFYFLPTNATQLQEASVIYGSVLSAEVSGTPVFIYLTQADTYSSGQWDFSSIQVGNNQ